MAREFSGNHRSATPATSPIARCFTVLCFGAAFLLIAAQRQEGLLGFRVVEGSRAGQATVISAPIAPLLMSQPSTAQASPSRPVPVNSPEIVVSLSDRTLQVYREGELQARYVVAIGQAEWPTPTGRFQVQQMQENPIWRHPITKEIIPPGPENPLGTRWIGFWSDGTGQIGLHGTNQTDLLGQAVSHGCIRMRDEDIQELYDQIQIGTVVVIQS